MSPPSLSTFSPSSLTPSDLNQIHGTVISQFDALPNRGKALPTTGEWCILSAVVAEESGVFWVVSLATGSKCVGPKLINPDPPVHGGYALHDSHAEVLAKRAFTLALLQEIKSGVGRLLAAPLPSSAPSTPRALKSNIKFHLYVTESPCGDAAIYNVDGDSTPTFTGAKICNTASSTASSSNTPSAFAAASVPIPNPPPPPAPVREPESQALSTLRLKSGRSNIPTPNRSLSHCCSDKILKWSVLGLGGSLAQLINPPPVLSSLVVIGDPRCSSSTSSQQESLTRAVKFRGGCSTYVLPSTSASPPWELSRMVKQGRFKKISASGMSINYTYLDSTAGKGGKAYTEITVGATGLKQKAGGKKKKKRKSLTPEAPVASPSPTGPLPLPPFSRLCRRELLRLAQEISPPPLSSSPSNYQQAKKLLTPSSYLLRKADVMATPNLKDWVICSDANNFDLITSNET